MKTIKYFLLALLLCGLGSCKKDFLQRDTGVPIDFNKVFSDPKLAAGFGDNSYNSLISDYSRLSGAQGMTSQFSDESISSNNQGVIVAINSGQFLSPLASDVVGTYNSMYVGIRNTNVMLANMDKVPWTKEPTYNPGFIKGEQYFLRAFFYFELIKRFGGVILLDKAQTISESGNDLARSSYDETAAFILKDLDQAIGSLPLVWPSASAYGRATKGAAMALKARMLLHMASPLNNSKSSTDIVGNVTLWENAAKAAKDVIDLNRYALEPNYADVLSKTDSKEYIMIKIKNARTFNDPSVPYIIDFLCPASYGGNQSNLSITQNHVDLYEAVKKTGATITSASPITDPTSGYDKNNPYLNRDPRFYNNVIYNDMTWQGRKVETFTGGRDIVAASSFYTKTSYYLKRLWPEIVKSGSNASEFVNFVYFRYAEILLNYAEAINEAKGPTADAFTAYSAVNLVRNRAGMPNLPLGLSKDQMRERIRNERAVEFAFEDMRWWDILRWKKGPDLVAQPMMGMKITKTGTTFSFEVITLGTEYQKTFKDYMHLYPIPLAEINKSATALVQNPGW
jgi:hypothetical protein